MNDDDRAYPLPPEATPSRLAAEEFVDGIAREYIKNGMFDGKPDARLVERLTRDIANLLDAHKAKPSKPKAVKKPAKKAAPTTESET